MSSIIAKWCYLHHDFLDVYIESSAIFGCWDILYLYWMYAQIHDSENLVWCVWSFE